MVIRGIRKAAQAFGVAALLLLVPLFAAAQVTVTINQAAGQTAMTRLSPINFTVVFSQAVTGFDGSDVSLSGTVGGALAASVTGSGTTYNVAVSGMTGAGTVVASIPAGVVSPSNSASTSTDNTVDFDNVRPTVTIDQAPGQADPTNASPIQFSVVFSEPVTGFTASDVFVSSSLNPLVASVSGSGANYTVSVTGMSGAGTVAASINSGAAFDAVANVSVGSTSTDNVVNYDGVRPTVTVNRAAGQAPSTNASPILFTVVFSEAVTGFSGADVSFAGSTVGGTLAAVVTGSGANYTVSVTGMNGAGIVVASVPANGVTDPTGNLNLASTTTGPQGNLVDFNNVRPTVTINQDGGQSDPTNAFIVFEVEFSRFVSLFNSADVSFVGSTVGGTLVAIVSMPQDEDYYRVSVTGMTGTGTVVASIPANAAADSYGNLSLASTSTDNVVTFDNVRPTVTINQAPGQADPTNTLPVLFTVTFSEPVTGFTSADVSLLGSTVLVPPSASVTGSGANYTVSVSGFPPLPPGNVVASVLANAAQDAAGNMSLASTSTDNTVSVGNARPSVTIDQAGGQPDPTNGSPILYAVTFSAPVTDFTAADVSFAGSTVGGALVPVVTGTGASYTVSVTGMTGAGTVVASIPAGAAVDLGNPNFASTSTDNSVTFDNVRPTVTINQAAAQADPVNGSPIQFEVVFSEPVVGFGSHVSFPGSTAGGILMQSVSGSGANYTVSVTGMATSGTVVASILANAAADGAGNLSLASTSTDNTVTFVATTDALSTNPGSLDFGGQSMNTTAPGRSVVVTNVSTVTVAIGSVTASTYFGITHDCTSLAPAASCVAVVTFTPGAEGPIIGSLEIWNPAGGHIEPLAGVGERSLVTHYYRAILRRAPDTGGKGFWQGEAARAQTAGLDVNEVWYAMAQQFFGSAEYLAQNRNDTGYVTDLYNTFFNRAPDGGGLAFWLSQLAGGMPREVALVSFMFSTEFVSFTQAIFGNTAVRAEINAVTDFYRGLLGRLPDDAGLAFWRARFRVAQCVGPAAVTAEAEAISSAFATGGEYSGRARTNPAYVGDLYNAFLRRGGDLGGVLFWIQEISTGARTRENVRKEYVASPEFQNRVAQVIAQGCLP